MKWLPLPNAKYRPVDYRCHYCGRTDGSETGDHKVPKTFGGRRGAENIVICCKMCNMIKSARDYGMFVALFREFLELRGQEHRAADPDDAQTIGDMQREFGRWLRAMQEAEAPWELAIYGGSDPE
jgi:5-methylcytosine-specific restriction endonuclease McrA